MGLEPPFSFDEGHRVLNSYYPPFRFLFARFLTRLEDPPMHRASHMPLKHLSPGLQKGSSLSSFRAILPQLLLVILFAFPSPVMGIALTDYYPASSTARFLNGHWNILSDTSTRLQIFGTNMTPNVSELVFTISPSSCDFERHSPTPILSAGNGAFYADVSIPFFNGQPQYFCIDNVHQGDTPFSTISAYVASGTSTVLPFPWEIVLIIVLLCLSGLFSGLNLGLMSLDTTELRIVMEVGSEDEQRYAKTIMPIRSRGNMLLCTVLLGNVVVNSTLTIFLDDVLGSGLYAVIGAAFSIVIIGEIFPQALCTRHALWVGAHTTWLMKFFMLLTAPVSYPISIVLNKVLGEEIGAVYQRKQLLKLIQLTKENIGLGKNEVDIITGALTFRDKTAGQIMTKLENVFMLDISSILDYKTLQAISENGHSRIPVYQNNDRQQVVGVLFMRDLVFVDPEDFTPLEVVIKHYQRTIEEVYDDTKLDALLDFFREGHGHMCMVVHIDTDGDRDPRPVIMGIITLEDVLEQIIQAEILDEKDEELRSVAVLPSFLAAEAQAQGAPRMMPQFFNATVAFLLSLHPFSLIPENILRNLLNQLGVLREIRLDDIKNPEEKILYHFKTLTNTFTMILEGRVRITVGQDDFSFESGPFTTLALKTLSNSTADCYTTDFSAEITSERTLFLQITRAQYTQMLRAAKRTTHISASIINGGLGGVGVKGAGGVGGGAIINRANIRKQFETCDAAADGSGGSGVGVNSAVGGSTEIPPGVIGGGLDIDESERVITKGAGAGVSIYDKASLSTMRKNEVISTTASVLSGRKEGLHRDHEQIPVAILSTPLPTLEEGYSGVPLQSVTCTNGQDRTPTVTDIFAKKEDKEVSKAGADIMCSSVVPKPGRESSWV